MMRFVKFSSSRGLLFIFLLLIPFFLWQCALHPGANSAEITTAELEQHVYYLASDDLAGRKPGTDGAWWTAKYIVKNLKRSGAELLGENGLQEFPVTVAVKPGANNHLRFDQYLAQLNEDFIPLSFSANASLNAPVVYAGYGFAIDTEDLVHNDYDSIAVSGKWVLVLRGDPDIENNDSPYLSFSSLRDKVLTATDHGAGGVLFVSGPKFDEDDELISMNIERGARPVDIPVIHIKRSVADEILAKSGATIVGSEAEAIEGTFRSFNSGIEVFGAAAIEKQEAQTANIIGIIRGSDPVLRNEYVVVGAHYDHLGFGGPGSGSRRPDLNEIHNGADDNASGVAAVLELAGRLSARQDELQRSVIFAFFAAEEMGVLGSKYFVGNPLVPLEKITIMFNLDMVGNYYPDSTTLSIGGAGTAVGLTELVEERAGEVGLSVKISPEGYGPSDHAPFYAKDVPVLSFFTGAHDRYHTPDDDAKFLSYDGARQVTDFAGDLIFELANTTEKLAFQEAGPREQPSFRRRMKVSLGIMPDHAAEVDGLRVEVVIPNRPGAMAGLENGDIIMAIDDKPVGDIYEYMHRLAELKSGQRTSIEVLRGDEKIILIVDL